MPSHFCRTFFVVLAALWALSPEKCARAQETKATPRSAAPTTTDATMSFHRVYVPADRIDEWPRGSVRYVPMDRDAFERAAAEIAAEARSPANREAYVERAEYTARLEEDGSLHGRAELVVAHKASRGVLLGLGECDLALTNAAWTKEPTQAVMGVGTDRKLKLLVERSGTLRFDFVLPPNAQPRRNRVTAAIPAAGVTRLLLDAPAHLTPIGENAIVEALVAEAVEGSVTTDAAEAKNPAMATMGGNEDRRRWKIELGSRGRFDLTLLAPRAQRDRVVLARQTTDYSVAPSGVGITSTLMLDVFQEPLDRLSLRLDPGVTLIATRVAGQVARVVESRRAADGALWIVVEPSTPISGMDQAIVIEAVSPLSIGSRYRLPGISAQEVQWQQSSARISVPAPLRIEQLWPTNAALAAAVSPREANLRYFVADAAVDLVVRWTDRSIRAISANLLELGGEARGQAVLSAVFSDATISQISGKVEDGWFVESITATPPEAMLDWRVVAEGNGRETIEIECRPGASRRMKISAAVRWRDSPERRPLTAADLRIIDWRESCHLQRSLVSLAPAQSYQLTPQRSHRLMLVEPADVSLPELFAGHPGQLQFDLDSAGFESAGLAFSVGVHRAATPFRAVVEITARLEERQLRETFRLRCTPQGDGLARVVVRLSPPSQEPVAWSLAGGGGDVLTSRRLSDDEARAFLIEPGSEAWLLAMPQPRATAFAIVGERTRPFAATAPLVLAALQEAETQSGQIAVRASETTRVTIENRRLVSMPRDAFPLSEVSDVQAVYRYTPARDVLAPDAAATVARVDRGTTATAIAYLCRMTAHMHSSGRVERRACYSIENFGRSETTITLPRGVSRFAVSVDGEQLAGGESSDRPIPVRLPGERRYVTLVVNYSSDEPASRWLTYAAHAAPEIDIPVLQRTWSLWMPEQYEIVGMSTAASRGSWSERWFGPLARDVEEPPFDPQSWQSWLGQGRRRQEISEASSAIESLVARIGAGRQSLKDRKAVTWSDLITSIADDRLFVDAAALDRIAIAPWTPLPAAPRAGERTVAAQLLFDAGLAVITDGTRIVLTSAAVAKGSEFEPIALSPIGGLQLAACWLPTLNADMAAESGIVTGQSWSRFGGVYSLPWIADDAVASTRGWRRFDLLDDDIAAATVVIDSSTVRVAAWVALLLSISLAWAATRRRTFVFVGMATAVVAALLLPDAWLSFAPIFSAMWWGGCIGLGLAAIRRPSLAFKRTNELGSAASWRWKRIGATTTFLLATLWVVRTWADDLPAKNAPASPAATATDSSAKTVHFQVFFPVDDAQKPVGSRVYVPEALFARLERWNLDRQRGPQGSLIVASIERVNLEWNADGTTLEPRSATAILDVHTFDDDVQIRLPLTKLAKVAATGEVRDATDAEPDTVSSIRLDGALVETGGYSIGDDHTLIAIAKAGIHRIELPLGRSTVEREGRVGIGVTPVLAAAMRIELAAPENGPDVDIVVGNSTAGETTVLARGRGLISLPVATAQPLVARWNKTAPRTVSEKLESTERLWLDVQPGGVSLAAEVLLRGVTGLPEEFRISTDPRLVPIVTKVDGLATTWRRGNNGSDQLVFSIGPRPTAQARLEIKFLLSGTTGIGSLRMPRWEPQVSEVSRRWLAVNIDPSLEREISAGPEAQPMNTMDFVQDEAEDRAPHYAWRLARGAVAWNLTTRHKSTSVRIEQAVSVIAEAGRARVIVDADVTVRGGDVLQHVLKCDPSLRVDKVAVLEGDSDAVAFWTASHGTVQIFLSGHAAERQRLRIEGHLGAPADGGIRIGDIQLIGAERTSFRSRIYRMPSVSVAIGDLTGFADVAASGTGSVVTPTAPSTASERFVLPTSARLLRDLVASNGAEPTATIKLTRNAPKIDVTSAVAVESIENDAWLIRAQFRGSIRDGIVDELMFDLLGEWLGEPQIEPTMPMTTVESPSGGRRATVRPVLPLRDRFNVTIEGRLRMPANRAAPRWKCLDADTTRELFVLPTTWQGRRLSWDLAQLRQSALDRPFIMPKREAARYQVYQAVGDRASAALQADLPTSRTLEAYVDIIAAEQRDGTRTLLTTYDLLPSGVASCRIQLPDHATLVAAILEDRVVTPARVQGDQWRIDLEGDSIPQRLQVLTQTGSEHAASHSVWQAPRLEDAQVRRTMWRIAPANAPPFAGATTASHKHESERVAARMDALGQLSAAAARTASDVKTPVELRWQQRVAAAIADADQNARQPNSLALPQPPTPNNATATVPAAHWSYVIAGDLVAATSIAATTMADQFGAKAFGRFGDDEVFQVPSAQAQRFAEQFVRDAEGAPRAVVVTSPPKVTDRATLLFDAVANRAYDSSVSEGAEWTRAAPSLTAVSPPISRWAIALGIVALTITLARPSVRWRAAAWLSRQPHLAIAGVGMLWWLFLWPGWIGLAVAAIGIASAWRLAWPLPKVAVRPRPSSHA